MYARMMVSRVKPGTIDESLRIWNDEILPAARKQSGFLGLTLLVDRDRNAGASISLWESVAALEAAEGNGFLREQTAKLSGILVGQLERHVYEVGLHAVAESETV